MVKSVMGYDERFSSYAKKSGISSKNSGVSGRASGTPFWNAQQHDISEHPHNHSFQNIWQKIRSEKPFFKAFRNVVAVWGSGIAIFFVFRNGLKMSFAERFWFWNPSFFAIPEWLKNNDSRTPNFSCFRNDVCSLSNTCLWFWNAKIWAIPERDIIKGSRMCWNLVFWNLSDLRHSGMAKKCHFQNVFSS